MDTVADSISITIPLDERFRSVSTLVLGGIGSRLELPFERMDDLQLAVLSLLEAVEGHEATLDVDAGEGALSVTVGPLRPGTSGDPALGRVVGRLVDDVAAESRDDRDWVTVRVSA